MQEKRSLQSIPDDELLQRLAELMSQSRRVEADIVAHIAEVDERRLYAREAFPSMFAYCADVLHLSEAEAYLRIAAARASREHPMLLTMLADGRLHLTGIAKLAPHLTPENRDRLLERATHRSKREIEELIAEIAPRPDVPAMVRRLPERGTPPTAGLRVVPTRGEGPMPELGPDPTLELRPDGVAAIERGARRDEAAVSHDGSNTHAPLSPTVVQPLSPGRYKVQFTASAEFHHKLERLRTLMGTRLGDSDLAAVIEQAVTEKLERLEARRFARTKALRKGRADTNTERSTDPSPTSRHIPAAVRRAVHERDGDGGQRKSGVDGARSATGLNSTIGTPSAWAVITAWRTSGWCVALTTPTWRSATTVGKPWPRIGLRGAEPPRRRPDSALSEEKKPIARPR